MAGEFKDKVVVVTGGSRGIGKAIATAAKGLAALGNRDDVSADVIHPGMVETDRVVMLFQQFAKAQNKTPEQVREESIKKSGTRRIGKPEDVAEVTVFLASPRARHIQGTAIAIDGGATTGLF